MDNDLPPLPDPMAVVRDTGDSPDGGGWIVDCECDEPFSYSLSPNEALFTAYQMRAYAALAVTAEREQCREVLEECIRTQAHLACNPREALSEASARIYKRGRA